MIIQPFPTLTTKERTLLEELEWAHSRHARRDCASTIALKVAMSGSQSFTKAVTAALATTGGPHAPIELIYDWLQHGTMQQVELAIKTNQRIPGWGDSFWHVDRVDDDLLSLHECIARGWPDHFRIICDTTIKLHDLGKSVWPNVGCYTASVAHILDLPRHMSSLLFIHSRLWTWAELCNS